MSRETDGRSEWDPGTRVGFGVLIALTCLTSLSSCQDFRYPDVLPSIPAANAGTSIQEGEVTLKDGEEDYVLFPKAFNGPPRVWVVELRQSEFAKKPFSKDDFQIVRKEWNFFRIRNTHDEHSCGSWATVKWKAEGVLAEVTPTAPKGSFPAGSTAQERMIYRVKQLGGTTELVPPLPTGTLVGIDLHATKTSDADLEALEGLERLRTLNLYDTRVTDAGLKRLSGLTSLQMLYLNDTGVSDAGLQSLQGLTDLTILGLRNTRVTDEGLRFLSGMTKLRELTLGGSQITDKGLVQLKGLKNLKTLTLTHSSVTPAGAEELKKALPGVHIVR
jgi:hypothetical protein